MLFSVSNRKINIPKLMLNDQKIDNVQTFNFLGIMLDCNLKWKSHIDYLASKIWRTVGVLNKLKSFFPKHILLSIYNCLILSHINYGMLIWGYSPGRIYLLQKRQFEL
jgi:hypothetical protein